MARGEGGGDRDGGGGIVAMVFLASVRLSSVTEPDRSLFFLSFPFSGSLSHCTSECVEHASWASWALIFTSMGL
jgi:hypothetical protein